jgi:uridine kinase
MHPRSRLIGIAGGSCAGKTELAGLLSSRLPGAPIPVLPLDAYYRDLTRVPADARAGWNFDDPEAIDWPLFVDNIETLADGKPVDAPIYDFSSHTRDARRRSLVPHDIIIVEGLFVLHRTEVRRRLDLTVFIDTDESLRFDRRLRRDTVERGRTPESVVAQWHATVRPMFERWVEPTRRFATLEVCGDESLEAGVTRVMALLRTDGRGRSAAARESTR